jgi:hypothetical protein
MNQSNMSNYNSVDNRSRKSILFDSVNSTYESNTIFTLDLQDKKQGYPWWVWFTISFFLLKMIIFCLIVISRVRR